jgi:hypothetical protein
MDKPLLKCIPSPLPAVEQAPSASMPRIDAGAMDSCRRSADSLLASHVHGLAAVLLCVTQYDTDEFCPTDQTIPKSKK